MLIMKITFYLIIVIIFIFLAVIDFQIHKVFTGLLAASTFLFLLEVIISKFKIVNIEKSINKIQEDFSNFCNNFYPKEIETLKTIEEFRIETLINQLGLKSFTRAELVKNIIDMKKIDSSNLNEQDKFLSLIKNPLILLDLTSIPIDQKVYKGNYYHNFMDFYLTNLPQSTILTRHLYTHIANHIDITNITSVVIPIGGNILLGSEIASKIKTSFSIFRNEGRIFHKNRFDGKNISSKDNVIILNDVIASHTRIKDLYDELLTTKCKILGIFCFIYRTDTDLSYNSSNLGTYVHKNEYCELFHPLVEINDDRLYELVNDNKI